MSEGPTPNPPQPSAPPTPPPYQRRSACACERCSRRGLMGPVILITVGALFMVDMFTWRVDFGDLWPVILIVVGVMKLLEYSSSTEGHQG